MYTVIKTTPQNFLNKVLNFAIRSSVQNAPLNQRDLAWDVFPFFYLRFVKKAPYLQKLNASLIKKYGNTPIIVFLREDIISNEIFLEKYLNLGDDTVYYWKIVYWRLFVFVEKSETEYIWLYTPKLILVPIVKNMIIPKHVESEILIDRTRKNISSVVRKILKFKTFKYFAYNENVKFIPVKVPPFVVNDMKNGNVRIEELRDLFIVIKTEHIAQLAAFLRENAESFIESIVSYFFYDAKLYRLRLPEPAEIIEHFLSTKGYTIKEMIDSSLSRVSRRMRDRIKEMSLEELEYYNNREVIYDELLKIYQDITDLLLRDLKRAVKEFVYRELALHLRYIKSATIKDIKDFGKLVDRGYEGDLLYAELIDHLKNNPVMREFFEKMQNMENLYNQLSEKIEKIEPHLHRFLEMWKGFSFLSIYESFLDSYPFNFTNDVYVKFESKFDRFVSEKIRKIIKEVVQNVLEKMQEIIENDISSYMVDEMKKLIEARLKECTD